MHTWQTSWMQHLQPPRWPDFHMRKQKYQDMLHPRPEDDDLNSKVLARVMPSGLWPSEHERPGGSSLEGIPAVESERFMISLRDACRECLPSLFRQHSP